MVEPKQTVIEQQQLEPLFQLASGIPLIDPVGMHHHWVRQLNRAPCGNGLPVGFPLVASPTPVAHPS